MEYGVSVRSHTFFHKKKRDTLRVLVSFSFSQNLFHVTPNQWGTVQLKMEKQNTAMFLPLLLFSVSSNQKLVLFFSIWLLMNA